MTHLEQDTGFFFQLGMYYVLGAAAFFSDEEIVVISLSRTLVKDLDWSLTFS